MSVSETDSSESDKEFLKEESELLTLLDSSLLSDVEELEKSIDESNAEVLTGESSIEIFESKRCVVCNTSLEKKARCDYRISDSTFYCKNCYCKKYNETTTKAQSMLKGDAVNKTIKKEASSCEKKNRNKY